MSALQRPRPLWGRVGVGGRAALPIWLFGADRWKCMAQPPSLALPHKGGGNRSFARARAAQNRNRELFGALRVEAGEMTNSLLGVYLWYSMTMPAIGSMAE